MRASLARLLWFVYVKPKSGMRVSFAFARLVVLRSEAQDYHPLGDHGFPKGNNQGLRPCMQALCA